MNPVAKWLGITVAVILLLISGATLLVSRLIDEAELKLRLLEMVNSSLDGTLEINGELSLSLWPRLSLALGDVHLRTPAGASEDFASASELRLGVNLMPLLRRQVSVDELLIKGFTLNARRDRNGNANWEALGTKPSGSTGPAAGTIASAAVAAPLLLAIDRVRIADGTLIFSDERTGTHHELRELDITSDDVNMTGDPFRLEGSARLLGDNGKHDIGIALGAQVDADLDTGLVRLANSRLTLRPAAGPAIELAAPGISASLEQHNAQVPAMTLAAGGLEVSASLDANWSEPGSLVAKGKLDVSALDLPALLQTLAITLPPGLNPEPLADITLDTDYALNGKTLSLSQAELRAGKFNATGEVRFTSGKTMRIDAKFASPELELDYFFPPAKTPPKGAAATAAAPAEAANAGPGALLGMNGIIEASLGRLTTATLELSELETKLVLKKGIARLRSLSSRLYGGTLNASGKLDARGDGALRLKAELGAVDLKALLQATREFDRMEGRLDGSLDLAASGHTMDEWMAALHGPLRIKVREPVLNGLSVEELICKAAAQLNQESLSARFEPLTRFQSIDTGLDFAQGIGTLQNFQAVVPSMALRGEGKVDLPRGKFDIQLNTRVSDDLERLDPACRMTRTMLAVEWPITCKGSFGEDPKKWCGIDQDDVAKIAGQLATDKVRDKLKDKLGDFFKRSN